MKEEISFEKAMEKLKVLVNKLETEELNLDQAIDNFSEGMKMAQICKSKLDNADARVNKIINSNGEMKNFKNMKDEE